VTRRVTIAAWLLGASLALLPNALDASDPPIESAGPQIGPEPAMAEDPLRPTPLLEKRAYIHNMKLLAHHFPGESRYEKMNMMAVGDRRYLVQNSRILDVSDPLKPVLVSEGGWKGGHQIQVAYNATAGKWLAITADMGATQPGASKPSRGISIFDISDPRHPRLLSQWSNFQGSHRNYYDGGRYAYVTGSDGPEWNADRNDMWGGSTGGLLIVDLSDPAAPKKVSSWHYPGQLASEGEARSKWSSALDRSRMATLHGPEYVPVRIEDGGRFGYGPWGALGFMIHDLSDPANPKLVSRWEPDQYVPGTGGLQFHTIDVARLDRGFVLTNPEAFWPQCRQPYHESFIVDVTDPLRPRQLATMPIPRPPMEAPYSSFCDRYGRFGPHNPPHLKAPGKVAPNFTCYSFFAAGLQCYDITDPREPKISAFFVPEQGGEDTHWEPLSGPMSHSIRTVDNVFVEWDRKLIWAATDSGLYLLSAPALGEPIVTPMPVREWTMPSINKGWQDFRAPGD
jgi:hypothetical protein